MSAFDVDASREVLARTPGTLRSLLQGMSSGWTEEETRAGSWRAIDIIGHLIQGELEDWIPRARIIIEHGEGKPFEPFGRDGFEHVIQGKTLAELLDDFEAARARSVRELDALGVNDDLLDRKGTHPSFGPVTLRQMLATWTAHDLSHIGQIADSMARRYRDEVGPWRRYLPVLDRPEEDSG